MTGMLHGNVLIVGGGPAGLAPLLAASQRGILANLLEGGVIIAQRSEAIGAGRVGRHLVSSDCSAETLLSCIRDNPEPLLAAVAMLPEAAAIAAHGKGAVPFPLAGRFMAALGAAVDQLVSATPRGQVLANHAALHTTRLANGGWSTRLRNNQTGAPIDVVSRCVVIATGGHQPEARLQKERIAGRALLPRYQHKLIQSDVALSAEGLADIKRRLHGIARPGIVVVGGSASALACARLLLDEIGARLQPGAITLLHRHRLKVFHASAREARVNNDTEFGPRDICPMTGFVFRFGGAHFDSRELVMQLRGLGGRPPENRIALHRLAPGAVVADSRRILDEADLVISCLGYRPRALPVFDRNGERIALLADQPRGVMVGAKSGVLDANGQELPGLYGIGLAAGLVAGRSVGGEPSFHGQMNNLWLWQNDVGAFLAQRLLSAA